MESNIIRFDYVCSEGHMGTCDATIKQYRQILRSRNYSSICFECITMNDKNMATELFTQQLNNENI